LIAGRVGGHPAMCRRSAAAAYRPARPRAAPGTVPNAGPFASGAGWAAPGVAGASGAMVRTASTASHSSVVLSFGHAL